MSKLGYVDNIFETTKENLNTVFQNNQETSYVWSKKLCNFCLYVLFAVTELICCQAQLSPSRTKMRLSLALFFLIQLIRIHFKPNQYQLQVIQTDISYMYQYNQFRDDSDIMSYFWGHLIFGQPLTKFYISLVMIQPSINLPSSENIPKDELNQSPKDFETIRDYFQRILKL